MIRAVIIDFDDTLCLTEEACFHLENDALARMGRPPQERAVHRATWGQPLFEAIKVRSPGVDVEAYRPIWVAVHQEWMSSGRIDTTTPENLRALDELLHDGKELFVLTSRTHDEAAHLLAPDHHLASRVKAFYYKDIMQYHKPDPRAFDALLGKYHLTPAECVYVGDSPSDAQAAKGAGLHFVACLEAGIRTRKDFAAFPVDAFVQRFAELPAVIASM